MKSPHKVHFQDRDTVEARHPEWETKNDYFVPEHTPTLLAMGALAGAIGHQQREAARQEKKEIARERAAAERADFLARANQVVYSDINPIVKWGARLVYAAGTAGIAFVLIRGFVFHNWS